MRRRLVRFYLHLKARSLLSELRALERSQWLDPSAIEAIQVEKLRRLLVYAGREVPFYRDRFKRIGFDPQTVRGLDDLARLPVLEREDLTAHLAELRSEHLPAGSHSRSTGGSTGRPLRFLVDPREMTLRSAHLYRHLRWLGWDLGDRLAFVWGSDIDSEEHRGRRARLRDRLVGVLWLDAFSLQEPRLDEYLDRLAAHDPKVLIGYPSSLHLLARRAITTGRRLKLRGIQTSAEMLAPGVRADLESAFSARVLDRYGCREAGIVAHECLEGGLHVNAESVVMECVQGEVLLTTLNNRAMPLIRYRNEDLAEPAGGACPCGRGLPLVGKIGGRVSDVIRSPAGRLIHGEFFTHLFYEVPGVRSFQVRQVGVDRLKILVVADELFSAAVRRKLEERILRHADAAFRIAWVRVDIIPPGPSGKFQFTICDLPHKAPPPGDPHPEDTRP